MDKITKEKMLNSIYEGIKKIEDKTFNVYFFILDTKGYPSEEAEYIYQTALTLHNMGYNVTMLHNTKDEFVGVENWLGKEFADLPHKNVNKDNVEISPSDFLFIPESFLDVISQTKGLPCKRIIILNDYNSFLEFMPLASSLPNIRVNDVIVTNDYAEGKIKEFFPYLKTYKVHPAIQNVFRDSDDNRKLIINIVSKEQKNINRIIKPFYWKYPLYKWVSFRDVRGFSKENTAEALREAAITIWIDDETNFGQEALEAMRCGTLLLAKIPNHPTDWMLTKNKEYTDACLWFDDIDALPEIIASVVNSWINDKVPSSLYEKQTKFDEDYTVDKQKEEIESVYVKELFEGRKNNFKELLPYINNSEIDTDKK